MKIWTVVIFYGFGFLWAGYWAGTEKWWAFFISLVIVIFLYWILFSGKVRD